MDLNPRTVLQMVDGAERTGSSFAAKFLGMMLEVGKKLEDKGIGLYGKIDTAFKAGLVKQLVDKGVPLERAMERAGEVFVSSELVPGKVVMARDTIMPFITFYYRFLEHALPEIISNPHRLLAIGAIVDGLQMAAMYDQYGEKWRKGFAYEREAAPFYRQMLPLGMGNYVRTPWGYFSLAFLPMHLPISFAANESLSPAMAFVLQNPILVTLWSMVAGRDPSTDVPITKMQALLRLAPKPYPPRTIDMLAAKGLLLDKALLWFNTTGSHKDMARTPVELDEVVMNMVLPTYGGPPDPHGDAAKKIMSIRASYDDQIRALKSKMKGGPANIEALRERIIELEAEKNKELEKLLQLRHEVAGSLL